MSLKLVNFQVFDVSPDHDWGKGRYGRCLAERDGLLSGARPWTASAARKKARAKPALDALKAAGIEHSDRLWPAAPAMRAALGFLVAYARRGTPAPYLGASVSLNLENFQTFD